MSTSIKEIVIKFIFIFLILFLFGYFIKWLQIDALRALALSLGITLLDIIIYIFKTVKKRSNK